MTKSFDEIRREGIGGTDLPVILGISPFKTITQLWKEKVHAYKPPISKGQQWCMAIGKKREKELIQFSKQLFSSSSVGKFIAFRENLFIKGKERPYQRGTVDAAIKFSKAKFGIEAKTTASKNFLSWQQYGVPIYYQAQCYWYGLILGIERWIIPVAFMNKNKVSVKKIFEFKVSSFPYSKEEIFNACDEFWQSVKEKKLPPLQKTKCKLTVKEEPLIDEYQRLTLEENRIRERKREISTYFKEKSDNEKGMEFINGRYQRLAALFWQSAPYFDKKKFLSDNPELIPIYHAYVRKVPALDFRLV